MNGNSQSLLLIVGYVRNLLKICHIPSDIIREINRFFYERFALLFAMKDINFFSSAIMINRGMVGIEYLDMYRKVSTHLNIFNTSKNCFYRDIPRPFDNDMTRYEVAHNFKLPPFLCNLLPIEARESPEYYECCHALFEISGSNSSVIVIDGNIQRMNTDCNKEIINGYQLPLPLPSISRTYYQLTYDTSSSTLYAMFNESSYSSKVLLFQMETEVHWTTIAEKRMQYSCCSNGSLQFISSNSGNKLMFVNKQKAYLFPLKYDNSENNSWIDIKDSNFIKMKCAMCNDSINNCLYVGCGVIGMWEKKVQNNIDLYDFHKNEWYVDIIPKIDVDKEFRQRPKFWMQNNLLFIGGGGRNSIPDVIFLDLRENKKQWKVFDNQWSEYFKIRNENQEQIIAIHSFL